ncbi:MAG: hypothetical protein E7665_04570 [Ruminococcaceae bacterium]|nr:hypothetical protein [Oscillospiraceae bacterium]
MKDLFYTIAAEPDFVGTHWCTDCLNGIQKEASKAKKSVKYADPFSHEDMKLLSLEERPVLILVGSLVDWMTRAVQAVSGYGIHCIMMTAPIDDIPSASVSTVSADYEKAFSDMMTDMYSRGKKRIGFFGAHPNSVNDKDKLRAFLSCAGKENSVNVFFNYGDTEKVCEDFFTASDELDGVICANDIIALRLYEYLTERGVSVPGGIEICAVGQTHISHMMRNVITTASLDFFSMGTSSVKICNMLMKDPEITSVHLKIKASLPADENKKVPLPLPEKEKKEETGKDFKNGFYEDGQIREIFRAEKVISHCLPIDIEILRALLEDISYSDAASRLYIAENTLKYRLKRMLELSECQTKKELLALVGKYLSNK